MINETVYLHDRLQDCPFYANIPLDGAEKTRWYKEWWATHVGKPARIIYENKGTLHIQFEGEPTAYLVGRAYLKP